MSAGEQLEVLESIIFTFAKEQFDTNDIPPSMAQLVMQSVHGKFREFALNETLGNMLKIERELRELKEKTGAASAEVEREQKEAQLDAFAEAVGATVDGGDGDK